uniref:Glycine betaine/L-proline ABC transporter, ATPase subunit n=1 Tax=Streptomyces auratus AGR0001 TaxID=1160718 RepID=J1RH33_9ACTN
MADSAEIVEPISPTSGAAGPGGSARSAGPDRPAAASASIRLDNLTKRYPGSRAPAVESAARRAIGYAIQATGLVPRMTVTETIGLVPKMAGLPPAKVRDRVEEMSNPVAGPRVLGSVLTVAMALIMDWLGTLVGLLLRPRGLEVD